MATFSRREHTTRHVEYVVPSDAPWGACWAEVAKAIAAAGTEYRHLHRLPDNATVSDDALRLFPGDDEIVIRFEVKERADG